MSWLPLNRERWPLAALIISAATLASVYILEFVFNQAPCQMCWWQRYAYFVAAPVARDRPQAHGEQQRSHHFEALVAAVR